MAERRCKICNSDKVKQVDKMLIEGATLQNISEATGFHVSTICRHKPHVAEKLRNNAALAELQDSASLLQKVEQLLQKAEGLLDKAENEGDLRIAISAVREVRGVLELLGKASGELAPERILIQVQPVIEELTMILRQEIHDQDLLERIGNRLENINTGE